MGNFQANIHVIKPQSSFRRKLPFMIFMNFHEQSPFHDQKLKIAIQNRELILFIAPMMRLDFCSKFEPPLKVVKIS